MYQLTMKHFNRAQITLAKAGSRSRRRLVGTGSKLKDDFEAFLIVHVVSLGVVGSKGCNFEEEGLSNAVYGLADNASHQWSSPVLTVLFEF